MKYLAPMIIFVALLLQFSSPSEPADLQQYKSGKKFSVYHAYNGWWAHIEGHAYPFGAWRMDRGPYPFKWMAQLEFPIERMTKDGPRR